MAGNSSNLLHSITEHQIRNSTLKQLINNKAIGAN